jgi:hypothetical protein
MKKRRNGTIPVERRGRRGKRERGREPPFVSLSPLFLPLSPSIS